MLTLILGGARSGKSDLAERLAHASGRGVLFLATMDPRDDDLRLRVERHRAGRPSAWRTVEEQHDVLTTLESQARSGDFIIVDCMTMWISNVLLARLGAGDDMPAAEVAGTIDEARAQAGALAEWAAAFDGDLAVVSNEVGGGVVPSYPLGRAFRDALGAANRACAEHADRVYWLTAGLALELKSLGARPLDLIAEDRR